MLRSFRKKIFEAMKMKSRFYFISALFLVGCSGEGNGIGNEETLTGSDIDSGDIIINEYCFKSNKENEFGKKSDWVELHNTTSSDIVFNPGEWTITDKTEKFDKYYIPETTIEAGKYLILWCDKKDTKAGQIHTNFKLKGKGETISLFYNGDLMDQQSYDSTGGDFDCRCRTEDAGSEWIYTNESTPGEDNESFDNY